MPVSGILCLVTSNKPLHKFDAVTTTRLVLLPFGLGATGCSSVSTYARNRTSDFADIWTLEASAGPGLDVHLQLSEDIGTILSFSRQCGVGIHNGVPVSTDRKMAGLLLMGGQDLRLETTADAYVPDANIGWVLFVRFCFPLHATDSCDRPYPEKTDVELGASLLLVGLHGGFNVAETGDFFVGLFGGDSMHDDYYPYLPDGEYISMAEAAATGELGLVRTMLKHGWDPNGENERRNTPLASAIMRGHLEIVRLLLQHGGRTTDPLHRSAKAGYPELVRLFLERGIGVNALNHNGETALHAAARSDSADAARVLLERGAAVDPKDEEGRTPLCTAARRASPAVGRLLVDAGAEIEGYNQRIPLLLAAHSGSLEMTDLLLKNGARVNARDKDGRTAPPRRRSAGLPGCGQEPPRGRCGRACPDPRGHHSPACGRRWNRHPDPLVRPPRGTCPSADTGRRPGRRAG